MKKFILVGIVTLLLALIIVVAVYIFLQLRVFPSSVNDSTSSENQSQEVVTPENSYSAAGQSLEVPSGGIPLNTLPLNSAQKGALSKAGIDIDTFVITQEMVVCAEAKIGAERFAEIIDGAAPGFTEGLSLLGCINK